MGARLLIAAGEAASGIDSLPVGIRALIDAADEIMVVAPRLPGRLDWGSATAPPPRPSRRVYGVPGTLTTGRDARGRVGADDPLLAFEARAGVAR